MYKKTIFLTSILTAMFPLVAFADMGVTQTIVNALTTKANFYLKLATNFMAIVFFLSMAIAVATLNEIQLSSDNPLKRRKAQGKLLPSFLVSMISIESILFGLLKKIYYGMVKFILATSGKSIDLNELTYKGAVESRELMLGFLGLLVLSTILAFMIQFLKLAKSADNPEEREKAIGNLWLVGVVAAVSGSLGLIVALFI